MNHSYAILADVEHSADDIDGFLLSGLFHQHVQSDKCSSSTHTGATFLKKKLLEKRKEKLQAKLYLKPAMNDERAERNVRPIVLELFVADQIYKIDQRSDVSGTIVVWPSLKVHLADGFRNRC